MSYYILSKCCSKNIRHSFTDKEDEQIKKLVLEYGEHDWKTISDNLGTRTPRQCRERYRNYLMPGIVNGPWTVDDDMLLYSKYLEIGPHWTIISQFFPSRSEINIKNRWAALSNKRNNKNLKQLSAEVAAPTNSEQSTPTVSSSSSVATEKSTDFTTLSVQNNHNKISDNYDNEPIKNSDADKDDSNSNLKNPICQVQASNQTEMQPIIINSSVKNSSDDEEFNKKVTNNENSIQSNFRSTDDKKQEILFSMIEQDLFTFNFDANIENIFQPSDFNLFFK